MSTQHAPALHIGKLRTRFMSEAELDDTQVRQWHEAFAEQDADALVGRVVSDDEWLLIRHLPLHLRWRPESTAPDVGRAWLQALQMAVEQAASGHDAHNVLRYRVWRHGLADLLYRSALGEAERQWAWQRMGLLEREGQAPADALMQGAQALLDQPDLIWPVLHHCLLAEHDTGAFTALARRVPVSMWTRWMQAAPQSQGWAQVMAGMDADHGTAHAQADDAQDVDQGDVSSDVATASSWMLPHPAPGSPAQALLQWAMRHPQLARGLVDVLGVWLAATTGAVPGGQMARHRLRAVRGWWQETAQGQAPQAMRQSSRLPPGQTAHSRPLHERHAHQLHAPEAEAAATQNPATHDHADLPTAPALPEPDHRLATAWAGALFFLRLLCQPGVMATLRTQAGLSPDETGHDAVLLQAVAMALHVPVDDPVMGVMSAGRVTTDRAPDVPPRIQAAANRLVAQWAQWLDEALPDAPAPRLRWVCQRPGRLHIEPGWIELHLDMDQIDTRLRRVGLDLDPAWVPLIGAVVRIRYD